jgi:hypothetical protein
VTCCTTCNLDRLDSLYPRYAGGRPPTFTLAQRRQIKQAALSRPVDHGLPFSTWSLAKLADFLVAEGLYGHIKPRKRRGEFLVFLRYLRTLYPPGMRLGIVLDNFRPHLSTRTDRRIADRAKDA